MNIDDKTGKLIAALATLMDAVATGAPRDFLEAAYKDGATAIETATQQPYSELSQEYFTWGRTE